MIRTPTPTRRSELDPVDPSILNKSTQSLAGALMSQPDTLTDSARLRKHRQLPGLRGSATAPVTPRDGPLGATASTMSSMGGRGPLDTQGSGAYMDGTRASLSWPKQEVQAADTVKALAAGHTSAAVQQNFSSSAMSVVTIRWSKEHGARLDREAYCAALAACAVPNGWRDAIWIFDTMKKEGHSVGSPVREIMLEVCAMTEVMERPLLYAALKNAGASYSLCYAAATVLKVQ